MRLKVQCFMSAIVVAGFAVSTELSTSAQGLNGAQMPKEILGRLVYVKGNSDQERWKTFLGVQPKLIGMSFEQMDKALSGKASYRVMTEVEYGLTQDPVNAGSDTNSSLHVRIFLRKGIVWKYVVEAVQ